MYKKIIANTIMHVMHVLGLILFLAQAHMQEQPGLVQPPPPP